MGGRDLARASMLRLALLLLVVLLTVKIMRRCSDLHVPAPAAEEETVVPPTEEPHDPPDMPPGE